MPGPQTHVAIVGTPKGIPPSFVMPSSISRTVIIAGLKCFQFKIKKQKTLYKVYSLENGPPVVDCCLAVYIREPSAQCVRGPFYQLQNTFYRLMLLF